VSPKDPPVVTWIERIDSHMLAGVASCYVVRHGCVYGLSVFVLEKGGPAEGEGWTGVDYWQAKRNAKDRAAARLAEVVAKECFGRLPLVGSLRDVGADGVNLRW